jgi:hypothetical protein
MTRPARIVEPDETFPDVCAYGSILWAATRLGKSVDWYYRNRDKLNAEGFPEIDPVIRRFLKVDVDKWIANRAKIAVNDVSAESVAPQIISRENLDAF